MFFKDNIGRWCFAFPALRLFYNKNISNRVYEWILEIGWFDIRKIRERKK